jgi:hypothetical protein
MEHGDILKPQAAYPIAVVPQAIPGLVAFWHFGESGTLFTSSQGEPYRLQSACGPLRVVDEPAAPFGGKALVLEEGQWLRIPRRECPGLDIHGPDGHLSLIAWICREPTATGHCEFIAGQWNETHCGRQYGLFLNIGVGGRGNRLFGHISNNGGPTPGYRYCMDGCMSTTEIEYQRWTAVAMSYDGQAGTAWVNGLLESCPPVNPYSMAGGLHDGGVNGSDFTVGAVHRSGEMGNFFRGRIAALAMYRRALTAAEMYVLCTAPVLE